MIQLSDEWEAIDTQRETVLNANSSESYRLIRDSDNGDDAAAFGGFSETQNQEGKTPLSPLDLFVYMFIGSEFFIHLIDNICLL